MATDVLMSDLDDVEADGDEEETPRRRMTLAEFHSLPDDDGVDRMLIRGELWEAPVTRRNRWHARIEIRVGYLLEAWAEAQPEPPGEFFSGEAGVQLPELETGVGVDVVYYPNESLAGQPEDENYLIGAPAVAVEILSPSDRHRALWAKLDTYLEAGVGQVWVIDPHVKTVVVHRPNARPVLLAGDDEMNGEPQLPGFRVPVAKFFSR